MKQLGKAGIQAQKRHRRTGYFAACLTVCVSLLLTACSTDITPGDDKMQTPSGTGELSATGNAAGTARQREWVYVPERIEIADKRVDYERMQLVGDTVCYLSRNGETEEETQNICQYSLTDRELTKIPIDWKDDGSIREICCYAFDENCNVWLIANVYSAGYSQFRRFLYQFDAGGENLFFQDITERLGSGISMSGMAVDSQGRIYVFSDEYSEKAGIWLYAADGSYFGGIFYDSPGNVRVRGAAEGKNGRFYVCVSRGEDTDHCTLTEVNVEGKQFAETIQEFPAVNGICEDVTGQYDFLLYDDTAAYGYDLSAQKKEELFVWGESDVNGYCVEHLSLSGDGRYFCTVEDWANDDRSIVLLTRTRSEEVPGRIELVLAAVDGGSELAALAVGFNRNNEQYRITVKNYGSLTDLYNAILAKDSIDLIDLSGVNIENLSSQGVLEDLSPWLDGSKTFTRADFLDGILEAYTFDGVLVGIPESFRLRTVVGDGNRMGDNAGLTLEGLLAAAERYPEAMPFDEITREELMQYLMMFNQDTFIDWEKGACHFDAPLFQEVLELCRRFPGDDAGSGQSGYESGYSSKTEEISLPSKIQNGDVLFAIADISRLKTFQLYEEMFGENAACVGFPTADGKGGTLLFADNAFGIAAGSGNKSGAWDFIESVLDRKNTDGMNNEEIYDAYYYYDPSQFPTVKKAVTAITDYVMETDKLGKFATMYYEDGWAFTSHALTWDEINAIFDLIPDATPYFSVEEDQVILIINEEAGAYYSGQKTAEDVISIIQNRVQLYVNENT